MHHRSPMNAGRARKPIGGALASQHTAEHISGREGSTVKHRLCRCGCVPFAQITHERGLTDETVPWSALGDGRCDRSVARAVRCYATVRRGASPASAASVSQQIGMKVLLITDSTDGTDTQRTPCGSPTATGSTRSPARVSRTHSVVDERREPRKRARCRRCQHVGRRHAGGQLRGCRGGDLRHGGPEHGSVGHAADLRAPVLGSPADRLCRSEQRLRAEHATVGGGAASARHGSDPNRGRLERVPLPQAS